MVHASASRTCCSVEALGPAVLEAIHLSRRSMEGWSFGKDEGLSSACAFVSVIGVGCGVGEPLNSCRRSRIWGGV